MRWTIAVSIILAVSNVFAESGVTDTEVLLGQSTAITGSGASAAKLLKEAADVYINKVNQAGGVHGRKIKLISLDDGYEPAKSVENITKLIEKDKVFAVFNTYGGAAAKAFRPILEKLDVPGIAVSASPEELRLGTNKNMFFVRASSKVEMQDLLAMAIKKHKIQKIASIYQNDTIGTSANLAIHEQAKELKLEVVHAAGVVRNTDTVTAAAASLAKLRPDAIVFGIKGDAASELIKQVVSKDYDPLFLINSSGLSPDLIKAVDEKKIRLYVTNVTPPLSAADQFKIVREMVQDLKVAGLKPSALHVEGYLAAMVLVEGLKRAGRDLTRQGLRTAMETIRDYDFGGIQITYSPGSHRGATQAFIGSIKDGGIHLVK